MYNADTLSFPDETVEVSVPFKRKAMDTKELGNIIEDLLHSSMFPTVTEGTEQTSPEQREQHTIDQEVFAAEPYQGLLVSLQIDTDDDEVDSLEETKGAGQFANVHLYAKKHNLTLNNLESFGINLVKFAMNNIVKNCPAAGAVAERIINGSETGLTSIGANGQRTEVLEITDRFFRNAENTYCHIRSFSSEGVASEVEQVVVTANETKVHIFRLNPSAAVKIAVVSADGKEGCMVTVSPAMVKDVLNLIN